MPDDRNAERPTSQTWDAALYDRAHSFVYDAAVDLIDLLAPQPGERILDVGAGTGQLTAKIAARGATVVGIDASSAMVNAAREAFPDIPFAIADVRTYRDTREPFDAVFSNATLHWVRPPADAVTTVYEVLKPGGRLVAEFGGKGNVATVSAAVATALRALNIDPTGLSPWYFPSVGEYASLLEAHGFDVQMASSFARPTRLDGPAGLRNWITMFGGSFLGTLPEGQRERFFASAEQAARPVLFREGSWYADYQRLRVVAIRR